jgi:hypothetical protein
VPRLGLAGLAVVAFALRVHTLAAVPLRWDEGWSIALGRLGPAEVLRLTALDVHPPLYYLLLGPWLALGGSHEFWTRFLSVAAATLAVPLAAAATRAWWAEAPTAARRAGLAAAGCAALAPAFVYYAGVTRMYALTLPCLFLAAWGLARRGTASAAAAILGATAALYAFYYTGFALAGLFAAALLVGPGRRRRTAGVALVSALLYLPWLTYAAPRMLERVGGRTAEEGVRLVPEIGLLLDGLNGAIFVDPAPAASLPLILAVLVLGALVARPPLAQRWLVVLLPVGAVLVGAALGAQAHMFAPRYTLVAMPFLVMGLGWALAGLWGRAPWLGAAAAVLLVVAVAPLFAGTLYARAAEVSGAYDPAADRRELAERSGPDDVVAFNILSLAGAYDRYRTREDPPWSYAQVWDPVREDPALAISRLDRAVARGRRLWLVLYKGTYSPGSAAVKDWADATLFPLEGWWRDDTLYQGYTAGSSGPLRRVPGEAHHVPADFGHGVRLERAAMPDRVSAGSGLGVELTWRATALPDAKARVFVHAYDPEGRLVAQHDAFPVADARPQTTWREGEEIVDRHGLWIPEGTVGPLDLKVGLYDPASGERWLLSDGSDGVWLGEVMLPGSPSVPAPP